MVEMDTMGRMSDDQNVMPDGIVPVSEALQQLGIKSTRPAAWCLRYRKMGAPIVPAAFLHTGERWGAEPETLKRWLLARKMETNKALVERGAKNLVPFTGQKARFSYTDAELHVFQRFDNRCLWCDEQVDLEKGRHVIRSLIPPDDFQYLNRRYDRLAVTCHKCLPLIDSVRHDAWKGAEEVCKRKSTEAKMEHARAHRGNGATDPSRIGDSDKLKNIGKFGQSDSALNAKMVHTGLDLDGWIVVLEGAGTNKRLRDDGVEIDLDGWWDNMPKEEDWFYKEKPPVGLRLERSWGRPSPFVAPWGTYERDGKREW